jgi:elongation factor Tu
LNIIKYENSNRRVVLADCPAKPGYVRSCFDKLGRLDGVVLVVSVSDTGFWERDLEVHARELNDVGVSEAVLFVNKVDEEADFELMELTEIQGLGILGRYNFDEGSVPRFRGSALMAVRGGDPSLGQKPTLELIDAIDRYFPTRAYEEGGDTGAGS